MTVYDQYDVVIVPFPCSDRPDAKRRPAVVLSTRVFNEFGNTVMTMVTSARHSRWPGDIKLDLTSSGLTQPCVARLKIFTLDNRLIEGTVGHLSESNAKSLRYELSLFLP